VNFVLHAVLAAMGRNDAASFYKIVTSVTKKKGNLPLAIFR